MVGYSLANCIGGGNVSMKVIGSPGNFRKRSSSLFTNCNNMSLLFTSIARRASSDSDITIHQLVTSFTVCSVGSRNPKTRLKLKMSWSFDSRWPGPAKEFHSSVVPKCKMFRKSCWDRRLDDRKDTVTDELW